MIVVKIGGGAGVDIDACCDDIASVAAGGQPQGMRAAERGDTKGVEQLVVVHGGSDPATRLGDALGHPAQFITTPSGMRSRYTDQRTLEIFTMALAGFNAAIVTRLRARGLDAIGLSGIDGGVLVGQRKDAVVSLENGRRRVIRDDRSGAVESVNGVLLDALLRMGHLPVLSPPAASPDGPINVDADRAAALVAVALRAHTLVLLTNVPGLLRDRHDDGSLVAAISAHELADVDVMDLAAGRMRVKLLAARLAVEGGVERVVIADGRLERPLTRGLEGHGTVIRAARSVVAASY